MRMRGPPAVRHGAATRDGRGEIVAGIVMMLMGENSRAVFDRVKAKIESVRRALPPGVEIVPFYDRTDLVRRTIRTVATNLAEGGLLVIVVLFLLLRNLRAGFIVASAIPLAMLCAFIGMRAAGVSGNLMSLGAIDFGLIVDGTIIVIENAVRRMSERGAHLGRDLTPAERTAVVGEASVEVIQLAVFGGMIIAIVYLPILNLEGIEGKMFHPMALTVVFALAGAFVLSLTLMPVLASMLLPLRMREQESRIVGWIRRGYAPLLDAALRRRWITAGIAAGVVALAGGLALTRGGEFIPELDEGAVAMEVYRLPSTSLEEAVRQATALERALMKFREVESVICRTGRAEIATDPMGPETSDVIVMLKARSEWRFESREELVEAMDRAIREAVPGIVYAFSQPIKQRMNELIAGTRSDVAIKVFGEDLEVLRERAEAIGRVVRAVPGASDVRVETVSGLPMLRVLVDRQAAARYGVRVGDVLDTVRALGGLEVGSVTEGAVRYAIEIRFDPATRADTALLATLPVSARDRSVPLGQVAQILEETGPATISRENVSRRVVVAANVRGRDLASFVADARERVEREVPMPESYHIEWGGQFEHLEAATRRLLVVVPLALALIFVLLYTSFGAPRPAAIIFLNVPFAATGA
jgi:cobalt-zinc-cadmium resistance protein CzcA